jgi:hypothetical protein
MEAENNRSFWHQRASDARARGEKTHDPRMREDLFAIAATCERLAELSLASSPTETTKTTREIENA